VPDPGDVVPGAPPDPVVPEALAPRLVPPLAGPLRWSPETGSTNDLVAERARAGDAEGLVIGTDHQTAGRGRRGREWRETPGEGLLFSVLLRPPVAPVAAGLLPLVVAVGVADGLAAAGAREVAIAWPNDVLLSGRKVGGILCELALHGDRVAHAVAGIGLNVHGAPPPAPGGRWVPGAVAEAVPEVVRGELLVAVLGALGARLDAWYGGDAEGIRDAFARRDHLAGRVIQVATPHEELLGRGAGIDGAGRLRLRTASGDVVLGAGEVTGVDPARP